MPESPPAQKKKGFTAEFVDFLKTFGIIGLAIAFVIGAASSDLVNSFVESLIDPFISLFLPVGNLSALTVQVPNLSGQTTVFLYGDLISAMIDFSMIALIVFILYRQLSKFGIVEDKTKPEGEEKDMTPTLEFGKLAFDRRSFREEDKTRNDISFFLEVKEKIGKGQKVNGCEAFMDIPNAGITHLPVYWRNGNRSAISIGLIEELQLFTFSSLVSNDQSEIEKRFIFYKVRETDDKLGYGPTIAYDQMDISSEVTISIQVEQGGNAPPNPYRITIKQILDTIKEMPLEKNST
ncbi:MAG TPA: MscL family protein [Nitrososphaeraceae archaeon]|jgi:large conductance mechanosensitive channel|nr:MscL family protein [Nitrososphaeraceae archaeon]